MNRILTKVNSTEKLLLILLILVSIAVISIEGLTIIKYGVVALFVSFASIYLSIKRAIFLVALSLAIFSLDQFFIAILKIKVITPGKLLMIYTIVIGLLSNKLQKISNLASKRFFLLSVILLFLALGSVLFSEDKFHSLKAVMQMAILIFWIPFLLLFLKETDDIEEFLVILISISALVSFFFLFTFNSYALTEGSGSRLIFEGLGINAIAINLGLAGICSIYLIQNSKSWFFKMTAIIALILITMFTLRTGTRSVVIGIPISILIAFIICNKINIRSFSLIIFSSVILGVIVSILIQNNWVSGDLLERLFIDKSAIEENSRWKIWEVGLDWFLNNMHGSGFAYEEKVFYKTEAKEAHNVFLSSLIQMSIPGFIVVVSMYSYLFVLIKRIITPEYKMLAFSIYFFIVIQSIKGSFLQTRLFWMSLALMLLIIEVDNKLRILNARRKLSKKHLQ